MNDRDPACGCRRDAVQPNRTDRRRMRKTGRFGVAVTFHAAGCWRAVRAGAGVERATVHQASKRKHTA